MYCVGNGSQGVLVTLLPTKVPFSTLIAFVPKGLAVFPVVVRLWIHQGHSQRRRLQLGKAVQRTLLLPVLRVSLGMPGHVC